ncbi:hypothetical protein IPH25_03655 [bacterium]|nr:MAG: hypothetical protein IPG37_00650 [bacterium]QQR61550.1 MAG: hypothetical protein IPH25_03655 [bacterium]QQR62918.1 MAG: hypothetical protein IPH67_00310 [bacterium]
MLTSLYNPQFLLFIGLLSSVQLFANVTHFTFRSATRNYARDYAIYQPTQNKKGLNGRLSLAGEWNSNFKERTMSNCLFDGVLSSVNSNDDDNMKFISISGSQITERLDTALLADYFYLPQNFESIVTLHPKIKQFALSPSFRLDLHSWYDGLYLAARTSFVHMVTHLNFKETVTNQGTQTHPAGYFVSDSLLTPAQLLATASDYFAGSEIPNTSQTLFEPLKYAKIRKEALKHNGMADTIITCGVNREWSEKTTLGAAFEITAPTGKKVQSTDLLEPVTGNGHHWEIGGKLNGSMQLWQNADQNQNLTFAFDVYVGHLFRTSQMRVFDLQDKPLSRYMLAGELESVNTVAADTLQTGAGEGAATGKAVGYQFAKHFLPVANATALKVDVSNSIQTELLGMLQYSQKNWSFNCGFNVWMRSKDKIEFSTNPTFDIGLKGDSQVYGFSAEDAIPLSATQNKATIFSGLRFTKKNSPTDLAVVQNGLIDNPGIAQIQDTTGTSAATGLTNAPNLDPTKEREQIKTSNPPVFITFNDLDIEGARTQAGSCKLFANTSYSFDAIHGWNPTVGLGGQVEWGHASRDKKMYHHTPVSQWGIWLNCAVSY